ncbi:MFS transporter [Nocardia alba]|uniref:EmrB/QacA subfamily drug resistance transporter n=1 Tax=Nocardia alba TaxID=225051 RepID=A0A4R1FV14_9NOCA|nr:MFS transporter [Nocardia alba]TCJ97684.1 EmrB/QacA subfamily drug resistance transporter [Nocardia alba]
MAAPTTALEGISDQPYSRRWAAMVILVLGFMLDLLNVTIVNVAIPSIQGDLGASASQAGWIVTAYLLAFAVTLITAARLGDLWGRKRVFLLGLAAFALTAAWSGVAQTAGELITARAAQGVAAALLAPQVMSSLYTLFQGRERATVLGLFGVVAGLAQAGGLLLGGLLVTADIADLGWRSVFWISFPAAIALLVLGLWLIPENHAPDATKPRWLPAAVLTFGLIAIVFPLLEGRAHDWAPWIWLVLVAGLAAVGLVAYGEHRDPDRRAGALLPIGLLRERTSSVALLVQLVAFAAFSGFLLVFVLWLQDGQGYTALRAGVVTIAFSAGGLAMAAFVGRLTVRFGRFTVLVGCVVGAVGTLGVLAAANSANTDIDPWLLAPGLFAIGCGMNLVMPPLTTLFLSNVSPRYAGSASGIWTTSQQFGAAIGVASLSAVFFGIAADGDYGSAFRVSAFAIVAALVFSAVGCLAFPSRSPSP